MTEAVREQISASLAAIAGTVETERRRILEELNHSVRRMTASASVSEWKLAVTDAARTFADFVVLWHAGTSGATHAIQAAIDSREMVVAACSSSEFPQEVLGQLGGAARAYVFPILENSAVLIAATAVGKIEIAPLEIITTLAGLTLGRVQAKSSTLSGIATAANGKPRVREQWETLPREEQQKHLIAQRFARVKVAEMQFYYDHAVKAGRKNRRLYENLRLQIDDARALFQDQFLQRPHRMADYLHLELVRTLANDDETLLGLEYPGPLA